MATPFRPAIALLSEYARYHRDRRNIATHFVGVPLIVFGVGVLLAGVHFDVGGRVLTLAWLVFALVTAWYLTRGAFALGALTSLGVGVLLALAHRAGAGPFNAWLAWGLGSFTVGWLIQFIGHYYEGRKPAFLDDVIGLVTAPMFVVLELLAPMGLFKPLAAEVERRAGPTLIRDLAHPATR